VGPKDLSSHGGWNVPGLPGTRAASPLVVPDRSATPRSVGARPGRRRSQDRTKTGDSPYGRGRSQDQIKTGEYSPG